MLIKLPCQKLLEFRRLLLKEEIVKFSSVHKKTAASCWPR